MSQAQSCVDCSVALVPRAQVEDELQRLDKEEESPAVDLSDPDAAAFCPSCGTGYTSEARDCVECGAALVPRAEIEEILESADRLETPPFAESRLPKFDVSDSDAVSYCPSCGAAFTEAATRCEDCDQALVSRSWVALELQIERQRQTEEAVLLCETTSSVETGKLEVELRSADIPFFARAHDVLGLVQGGLHDNVRFYVSSEDFDRAEEVWNKLGKLGEVPRKSFPRKTESKNL